MPGDGMEGACLALRGVLLGELVHPESQLAGGP
eukprot:CAMPEP_0182856762 /NCGR_PEP_ID=MMETSP0034_2-20130328/2640_1 /TAXON_ID=156128 /ORGANISM="Nephroselmis pyriformis, Strain CCMP717" /LENGTH=32 /DNA_ID= /DNA_START= /DNA_END= /DNA_ORIENTATION=